MPPQLALVLSAGFVIFLFRRERSASVGVSHALWIPLLWVLITGSRFASQWLGIWGVLPGGGGGSAADGSPLDALVFLGLIIAGLRVLQKRRVKISVLARENIWITIFFLYCFCAVLWSDFPFVALKRWIKILGHPVMALVILTEANPLEALRLVFKRTGYVLLTGSVLLIKYYPHIGRGFDSWTGEGYNQGVNLHKNELGYVCLLTGIFFFWNLLQTKYLAEKTARRNERILSLFFLAMILWLLHIADSATSLACTLIGITVVVILGFSWVNKKYLGVSLTATILFVGIIESTFGVYDSVIVALGRDPTLTDRTKVWQDVLGMTTDPVFGAGFESFWLGERLERLWAKWAWHPNQAHNGYIETYINLGGVGVALLVAVAIATFKKGQRSLIKDSEYGRLRLAFWVVILIYNFTEAAFKGVSLVWLVWHIISLDYPRRKKHWEQVSSQPYPRTHGQPKAGQAWY
jgi:O-antigen ligase